MLGVALPLRPLVCSRYHVEVVADDAVAFVGENGSTLVRNPAAEHVVPMIDGRRTTDEIAISLGSLIDRRRVEEALGELVRAGLVVEAADLPAPASTLWAEIGVSEFRATELLDGFTVGIETLTDAPLEALHASLADFAFSVADDPDASDVKLVVVDDYLDPRLAEVDARAGKNGQRWFLIKPTGVNVWVGPGFVPGRTACWQCLAHRLRRNRPVDDYLYRREKRHAPVPVGRVCSAIALHHAYPMAVTQLARWVACVADQPPVEAALLILETLRVIPSWHTILPRPQCATCGDPKVAIPPPRPPRLDSDHTSVVSRDGREHAESPETVFDRYAHLISPVTGMVSAVVPSSWNSRSPLRSFSAGHNSAMANDSLQIAGDTLRMYSSGKGMSEVQARTSALCEALERGSGVYTGDEPTVHDTLCGLGDAAVDPRSCMLFSDRQYQERDRWQSNGNGFQVVPWPFEPNMHLDWSPLWSISQARIRYLPTSYLYYGYPRDEDRFVTLADSNGNAAGTTIAQACLQGLYELIERDCVALWWYNRIARPSVDLGGLGAVWIDELHAFYDRVGREFWLLDLTSDLHVPAFAALSRRTDAPTEDLVMGFGAHHEPRVAAARALTEMNQFMPAVLDVNADGSVAYHVHDPDTVRWWTTARVADHPYLRPSCSQRPSSLDREALPATTAAGEGVRAVVAMLEARGLEVLVLDQTRPDIGLPVVKMVVPGLRHYWARFAPGRLYDVPVDLGWVTASTHETALNPIAMFV